MRVKNTRVDYKKVSPDAITAMMQLERYVNQCSLEKSLLEFIKIRASQMNGCAYCVDMHTKEARKAGESERRLYGVTVWQESSLFTNRERAALAWTKSLTLLPQTLAPDEIYQEVHKHFSEKETVDLTMAIITINS